MKALRIATVFALILTSYATFAQSKGTLETGLQKLEAKDYLGAIDNLSTYLKEQPTDSTALSGIIRAYMFSDNQKEAQRYIDIAIKEHPSNAEFFYRRGLLNNIRGQFRKAIADFDKAYSISGGGTKVNILINRGISHLRDETPEKALADFEEALTINPRSSSAYSYRGFVNHRQGNYADAIADFNKAIDLDPENMMSHYNRGMAYHRIGDKTKACADFHKACSKGNMNACKMIVSECSGGRQE
jgi:tetratricopeptide (TPR) repeat protein